MQCNIHVLKQNPQVNKKMIILYTIVTPHMLFVLYKINIRTPMPSRAFKCMAPRDGNPYHEALCLRICVGAL
jgi:hypothetical protein